MAQIVLQNSGALLLLPLGWLLLVLFAWPRRFRPFGAFLVRLVLVVLLALALAQPVWSPPEMAEVEPLPQQILLVDQSASLGTVGQQALRSEAARLAQNQPDTRVFYFADRPLLVRDPLAASAEPAAETLLNPEVSNLADALQTAGQLLVAGGQAGRVGLLSDGVPTAGNARAAAAELARQLIPVDVWLPSAADLQRWVDGQNEVQVVELTTPPVLRRGQNFDVQLRLHSGQPVSVTLTLEQNGAPLAQDVVALAAGDNRFNFAATANELGAQIFRAAVSAAAGDDHWLQNNSLFAFAQVFPPPAVWVVSDDLVQASRFSTLLRDSGFEVDVSRPVRLPTRLSELDRYAGLVLINVPAEALELEQMIAVQEFVRSMGRGLTVIGGRESYTLGRYEDTPLADLLPLSLEPPPREERPPVALLLVMDHSGSMMEQRTNEPTRLTMAKEAAIRATEVLGPDDLFGVLMFDNKFEWVVPFQPVSDGAELLEIQQRIARIPGGGGTRILQALEVGIPALIEQETAASRHIVLLTDGKSFDGAGKTIADYNKIVDTAAEANITLSTIAIGAGADEKLLSYLAERGLGRYHFAGTPEELPELTISESDILRSDSLQEGDFAAAVFSPHPIIRGLFLAPGDDSSPPNLSAYLAMTPKPQAEVALQVGPGDPLLAVWGYGLGRVAAWSSDSGAEWATNWRIWPPQAQFWGQVVGYTLPSPNLAAGLQIEAPVADDGLASLTVDSLSPTGRPVDFASTTAALVLPDGTTQTFALQQAAPGKYGRQIRLPESNAFRLTVNQPRSEADGGPQESVTGLVRPYRTEYALPPDNSGEALLREIAQVTGGKVLPLGQSAAGGAAPNLSPADLPRPVELWPWLLQIALVLWPLEIALRRWGRLRIQ